MSLAVLADHMASKGRGPDSMLIHMSPREVQGLQALAMKHGGSLTINPDTGLPEAGFLDNLLPTILGAGLTFMGVPPNVSAMIVGGIQTVRTGDLGKGIQAGLGAYGGAGLTAGMTAAGESAIGSQAAGQSYLASSVPSVLEGAGAGLSADMAYNLGQAGIDTAGAEASRLAQQAAAERIAAASPFDKLSAGAKAVSDNPMSFANKDNLKYLAAAAGPAIMAGMNVQAKGPQTVTKPGMIRPYSYDPYSGNYVAGNPYEAAPTKAADGGLMGMDDGGYSPGMLDFAQRSEPVLRMAEGGIPGYADGALVSDQQIFDYFKSGPKSDEQIARDMGTYNVTAADIARATGTQDRLSEYENRYAKADTKNDIYDYFAKADTQSLLKSGNDKAIADTLQANDWKLADVAAATGTQNLLGDYGTRYVNAVSDKATDANEFLARAADVGLTGADLAKALQGSGMSAAAQYALTHNLADTGGITGTDFYSNLGYKTGALPGDQGGLEGLYANINYSASGLQSLIDSGKMTVAQAQDAALAEMQRSGTSLADIKAATGKSFGDLFKPKTIVETKTKITGTGGTGTGTVTPPPFTSVIPGGNYGRADGSTPGDITTNPDGTVTVHPNIPYRPPGGFSGMGEVRDAYTKGGGSLGYIPYAPKTIEEFDKKYNKLTGGSKQSYDYLMGKTPYSPTPYTPTGEVMKPYAESVLGMPVNLSKKMYIFDPATKTYKINPDYAIPTYDSKGNKVYNVTNKDVITYMATKPAPADFYNWAKTNNLTVEQIAAATGMPITEVQKMLTGGTPKDTAASTDNIDTTQGGGGGGDSGGPGGGGGSGTGPGGVGGAGGPASTTAASPGDFARGGLMDVAMARGGAAQFDLGDYSDGGRLLRGPGDGVSDSIPASIGNKRPARLADGEFVVPARIVSELGNGSTEAGARKLYAMMDRIQAARRGTVGKGRVAKNSRADKHLPA